MFFSDRLLGQRWEQGRVLSKHTPVTHKKMKVGVSEYNGATERSRGRSRRKDAKNKHRIFFVEEISHLMVLSFFIGLHFSTFPLRMLHTF